MKVSLNLLILAILASGISFSAFSAGKYGMAGCGLGSIVMGPSGGQILAATTNGTSSSQSWGLISGTSNCLPARKSAELMRQKQFLSVNLSTLQKEMAKGNGETLDAFVETLGCEETVVKKASLVLTQNYRTIFSQPGIDGVLDSAKGEILKTKKLAKKCSKLG